MISYWLWKTRCSEEWLSLDSSNWFSECSISAVLLFSGVLSFIYLKTFLLFFLKRLLAENICYVACSSSSRKHSCWLHFNTMKTNHELMVIVNLSTESHIFRQCGYLFCWLFPEQYYSEAVSQTYSETSKEDMFFTLSGSNIEYCYMWQSNSKQLTADQHAKVHLLDC